MLDLLHRLLNSLLFSGTLMFAAGVPALGGGDPGGGGSDGGSGAGEGAGGASENISTDPGQDTPGDGGEDLPADPASTDGAEVDPAAADPNAPVDLGDGRQVPGKWKKLFDAAKAQGLDKEVKQLFFGQQRLLQKLPGGVNEAIKLVDTVKEFGGIEGISGIKSDNEAFHADADTFVKDPGKWLEANFGANTDASLKTFATSLDYVADHHPEHYNHLMAKVIINDLEAVPVREIHALLSAMKDSPQAKELAGKLAKYYNERNDLSRKVPEKKVDAERVKLEADQAKLGTEREQLQNHTVNSQTIPLLGREMTTQLTKLAKEAGFDLKTFAEGQPEAASAMRGKILNKVMEKAASDPTFVKNYRSVMKQGDTKRAVNMMNKKHNEILPEIVREVAKGFGIAKKTGAAKPNTRAKVVNAATVNSGAVLRVSEKPDRTLIDWSNPKTSMFDSVAVLKDGRTVSWA